MEISGMEKQQSGRTDVNRSMRVVCVTRGCTGYPSASGEASGVALTGAERDRNTPGHCLRAYAIPAEYNRTTQQHSLQLELLRAGALRE